MKLGNSLYPILYGLATFSAGDLLAQGLEHARRDGVDGNQPFQHDRARTGRALVIGGTAALPTHYYFLFLSTLWKTYPRGQSILYKVGLNLVTLAPVLNSYFFGMQSLLSHYGTARPWSLRWSSAAQRIKDKVPRACVEGIFFWPTATAINLALVPPRFQYIPQGMAGIVWQSVLSMKNSTARKGAGQLQ